MKKLIFVMLAATFLFVGCLDEEQNADTRQAEATKKITSEAERQVGMPNILNFQERKLAKMIFELRDKEDLICYAYIKSDYTGKLHYIGKCLGFGLPYSVQFTNPERAVEDQWGNYTLPQPDPNGLFMPEGLSATWLMMIDPKTEEPRPVYVEPEIVVSPFPLGNIE